MGADLYIEKLPRENQYTGLQTKPEVGYFRDSYNNSDLMWQFGLSWWSDMAQYMTEENIMTPDHAKQLLKELQKREVLFDKNMADLINRCNHVWDYEFVAEHQPYKLKPDSMTDKERQKWVKIYKQSYKDFKKFLKLAIKLDSDIECSI